MRWRNRTGSPGAATQFYVRQLESATSGIPADAPLLVAYEPAWAIGAAKPAAPEYIVSVPEGLQSWIAQRADKG